MSKINLGAQVVNYPMPVAIVGTMVNNKPNFLTVAWLSMATYKPPTIIIMLNKLHYSNEGIKENKTFSICFPSKDLVEKTDYVGIVSGKKIDKSTIFNVFYGETGSAPMIEECPLCIECKLGKIMEIGIHEIFAGEIIGVYSEDQYLTDGEIDFQKTNPFILSQNSSEYWGLGDKIGNAWSIGKELIKK